MMMIIDDLNFYVTLNSNIESLLTNIILFSGINLLNTLKFEISG